MNLGGGLGGDLARMSDLQDVCEVAAPESPQTLSGHQRAQRASPRRDWPTQLTRRQQDFYALAWRRGCTWGSAKASVRRTAGVRRAPGCTHMESTGKQANRQ